MGLQQDIPTLLERWESHKDALIHNEELFNIFEGNLLKYVLKDLSSQMTEETFNEIATRIAPINVLKRLIEKLSKIYAKSPVRTITGGSKNDEELLAKYVDEMDLNTEMGSSSGANGFFNLFKNTWIEPYLDGEDGGPKIRVLPSNQFFVYSDNAINPTIPTHLVKIVGTFKTTLGEVRMAFHGYTATECLIFDDHGELLLERMLARDVDGTNPYGVLPGVYINRSRHTLMPQVDSDTLTMTKLIPVLLSDLNYALKYQCFSIIYTIDCDQSGLTQAPNALWDLKSASNSEKPPQIGSIKPDVDSDKALAMIRALFSLWMQTRNIKPGSMGDLTVENSASGIAKAIDEMDTSEDRQNQVPYFKNAEQRLWSVIQKMHAVWSDQPNFKFKGMNFSPNAKVMIAFAEQRPNVDPVVAVDTQIKKLDSGLQTIRGALKELYPDWNDKELDQKMAEIEKETADKQAKREAMMAAQQLSSDEPVDNEDDDAKSPANFGKKPGGFPAKKAEPVA